MSESISQSVGGKFVGASATLTRDSTTTQYTSGDVVSDSSSTASHLLKFSNMARLKGGSGAIIKAQLATDKNSDTSSYRLYLYTRPETALTIPLDNAAYTALYADQPYLVGFIDFPALAGGAGTNTATRGLWTGGVGSTTEPSGVLPFVCYDPKRIDPTTDGLAADTALYGLLVALGTPTPSAAQKYLIELTALQN